MYIRDPLWSQKALCSSFCSSATMPIATSPCWPVNWVTTLFTPPASLCPSSSGMSPRSPPAPLSLACAASTLGGEVSTHDETRTARSSLAAVLMAPVGGPGAVPSVRSPGPPMLTRVRDEVLTRATGANFGYFFLAMPADARRPDPGDAPRSTGCGRARRVRSRFRCSHRSKGIPRRCSRAAPEGSETEGMERRCHGPPRLPLGSRQSRARASPRRWRSCLSRSSRSSGAIPGSVRPLWAPARGRRRAVTGTPPRATSTGQDADRGEDAPSSGTTTSRAPRRLRFCATPPGRSRGSSSTSTPSRAPPSSGWCPSATARTGLFCTSRCRREGRGAGHRPTGPCSSSTRARRVRSGQGGGRGRVRGRRPEGHRPTVSDSGTRGIDGTSAGERGEPSRGADELEEVHARHGSGRPVHHRVHRARRGVRRDPVHVRRRAPRRRRRRREDMAGAGARRRANTKVIRETNRVREGAVRGVAGRRGVIRRTN